ncbi:transcriptional regulator [Photobacterium iliopiscarium]|uniref:HTH-type transcriptional regulator HdfR n=1 Tax=Photobacterium iliopiscarium TaxID=56192 RepID=A0A0D8P745_9GAMM|nr:HTH-type transcriptional regulator HdfR [Photobacterium iliopiscarium]KJG14490.1 transcriptional regulator [Photobacterium iliopiscarium]KJG24364.1 transcriptional regulator [Photobacterium iliopiscarium]MCD9465916.1 HTH-type transcriptional regulator HdfR [Photobacterium iliopiscarium]MCD9487753.1 HTH-type transcriptional regulator HdfR [Photobacterium iliopiscarium]MCF2244345.1 HTH-type transcriptional regulator HdfR [Photobacterium iliopiscarium]
MDTELLKTFLEVTKTRHFGRAADNLYLTQSAVSFRIRQLESQLGNPLFSRQRGNVHLTAAGERLQPYAEAILQTWGRAKQDVALTDSLNTQLAIGASPLFWEFDGISVWINRIYATVPSLALRLESVKREGMAKRLFDKSIDVFITSEPPKIENLHVHKVRDYQLQLVTNQPNSNMHSVRDMPLIYLDWGTRFSVEHSRIPELQRTPVLHTHSCKMALDYILANGGVGYFPSLVVASGAALGKLYVVEEAPVMEQSLYLVWREGSDKEGLINAIVDVPFKNVIESI